MFRNRAISELPTFQKYILQPFPRTSQTNQKGTPIEEEGHRKPPLQILNLIMTNNQICANNIE